MRGSWLALALGTLLCAPDRALAGSSFDTLGWLAGDWVRSTKRGEVTERWRRVSENTFEGVVFVQSGDSTRVSEYLRIERFGEEVFYTAKPGQNPFPTSFKATVCSGDRVVFENPDHDFPQRIIYTRDGDDGLRARIEGLVDGEVRAVDFRFRRKE